MTDNLIAAEIAKFDALAAQWWDPAGPMAPLHAMNPPRIGWIAARLPRPARLLDLGCGAGLAAEALARLGHQVLGVDAAERAIDAARAHAPADLPLTYRTATASTLLAEPERFDAITALEIIEHVPDPPAFIRSLAALLVPGGRLFLSTLNRTPRAWLEAKLGAEYVLRLLPVGTHAWRRFLTPAELAALCRAAGLRPIDSAGLRPTFPTGLRPTFPTGLRPTFPTGLRPTFPTGLRPGPALRYRISRDLGVNYLLCAEAGSSPSPAR